MAATCIAEPSERTGPTQHLSFEEQTVTTATLPDVPLHVSMLNNNQLPVDYR
jgi:hypothetical protein